MLAAPPLAGLPHEAYAFSGHADFLDFRVAENFCQQRCRLIEKLLCFGAAAANKNFGWKARWRFKALIKLRGQRIKFRT